MKIKFILKFLLLILLLGCLGAGALYYYLNQQVQQTLLISKPQLLTLGKGQSARKILVELEQQKIIGDIIALKILLKLKPQLAKFKAGTYELLPGMQTQQLLDLLVSGKEKLFSISLVEGLQWREWELQLKSQEHLVFDATTDAGIAALISDLPGQSIEGWLLPDTYHFATGTNAFTVISIAHQKMRQYLEEQWHVRALDVPYANSYEGLIMASIIEKETAVPSERPRIAGVFVNRLNLNMRLQTDPTVIYGLGPDFDGDIKRKDLKTPTPYNTYVIKGLPPTPIAMPGKLSIAAAFNPLATNDLYFVARGDGSHQFSETLQQHNQAVKQYILKK
ncbi:endolytic transglycosylase MltG [Paraglaciecola hydrolytica]|uniref:Endolytic murein transglycosylase n=1 Tax=Paraglaciecola hydrolytica TaxID=1799789 RepID=A0A136A0P7_9ALTE|nr:endolytic transglycosylase MltG [Paraglaciecola hydrolytica]KXI28763.1 aminodeoxychorismate lyase [Paraglaciecola hydrolytica]